MLWPGFELRVALRFLREGRMQTVLIIVGVAAGVAVIAYISALISGLQNSTLTKTLGAQAHISVRAPDDGVTPAAAPSPGANVLTETQPRAQRPRSVANWQALLPLLEKMPNVAGVSPMVSGAGLALRGEAVLSIALMGVELERYDRMIGLRSKVVSGSARLEPGEAIVGRELAQDLGVRVGDRLTVQTTTSSESLRVTADGWAAQNLADTLRAQFPYKIESWQESNAQLVSALNAQSVSTGIIRGVVLAVVVLGIASVLVVSVVQKRREIGILRAMGATRGQVLRLFLVQGAVVGAVGSLLGLLLAVALIWAFTHFVRGSDGLPLFSISLPPATALRVALVATVCGVLAAIAPARSAARLDPAQAIRI